MILDAPSKAPVAGSRTVINPKLLLLLLLPPVVVTAALWATSLNPISTVQGLIAGALLCIPWWSYCAWKRNGNTQLPLFACVAFMYWIYFAVPLFWGDRFAPSLSNFGAVEILPDNAVTQAMMAALIGVCAIWLGARTNIGKRFRPARVRDIPADPERWNLLRIYLLLGIALNVAPDFLQVGGTQFRQVLLFLQTTVPLLIFIIFLRNWIAGTTTRIDKFLVALFLLTQLVLGLAGGFLGTWLSFAIAGMLTYLAERRKIPMLPVALAVVYVLFFQPGKHEYRLEYWNGSAQPGVLDKIDSWVQLSLDAWQQAFSHGSFSPQLLHDTVMRASLLTQAAHVMDVTPREIPFQNGWTYSYVVEGLIPRAIWPDKPSAQQSIQFYQVTYGLISKQAPNGASISVGSLMEAYINFGWPGIVIVMFLVGMLLSVVEQIFLVRGTGRLFTALGIMMAVQFMTIEWQMSFYVSGLLQTTVAALIVLWPVTLPVKVSSEDAVPAVSDAGRAKVRTRSPRARATQRV